MLIKSLELVLKLDKKLNKLSQQENLKNQNN